VRHAKPLTICDACLHLHKRPNPDHDGQSPYTVVIRYCAAFPEAIPSDIWEKGFDHRRPYPGDNGIRFALRPGYEDLLESYEELVPEEQRTPERNSGPTGDR